MEFENLLQLGRKGSALLFCGAGFSADCLSFASDETIGAGARLTALLNAKLAELGEPSGYAKLQNVGDAASLAMGENGLMNFLKESFDIKNVSADMADNSNHTCCASQL